MSLSLVVAVADNEVVGAGNDLPWHVSEDLKHFRQLTTGHVLVAGRRTHESITGRLGHPLPGRHTVVVSRSTPPGGPVTWEPGAATVAGDLDTALGTATTIAAASRDVVVVGGVQVYEQALPRVDTIHLTRVHLAPEGDAWMPAGWLDGFTVVESRDVATASGVDVTFQRLTRG